MARKRDVDFSLRGEAKVQQHPMYIPKAGESVLMDDNSTEGPEHIIFRRANTGPRGGVHIPGIGDAINPKTGKMERMRLLTGIDTIWVKEQKDISPEYIKDNQRSIVFPRGQKFIAIQKWDKTALEFMRLSHHNIHAPERKTGSKWEFYEYNPALQAKAALEKEMYEIEMIGKAQQQQPDFMRKHAAFLGIPLADEYGYVKEDTALRSEYILYAKRNPKRFEQTLNSKEVEIAHLIKMALSKNFIDVSAVQGSALWSSNQVTICRIPPAVSPFDHLMSIATSNSTQGRDLLDGLKALVN